MPFPTAPLKSWSIVLVQKQLSIIGIIFTLPTCVSFCILDSGLLVAYLSLRYMEKKNGELPLFKYYFHRFWRQVLHVAAVDSKQSLFCSKEHREELKTLSEQTFDVFVTCDLRPVRSPCSISFLCYSLQCRYSSKKEIVHSLLLLCSLKKMLLHLSSIRLE